MFKNANTKLSPVQKKPTHKSSGLMVWINGDSGFECLVTSIVAYFLEHVGPTSVIICVFETSEIAPISPRLNAIFYAVTTRSTCVCLSYV